MELDLISKDKRSISIKLVGQNETLTSPLLEKLLADDKVEHASHHRAHLFLDPPVIDITVNEGKPQTALKRAAKAISSDFRELRERFEKLSA